MAWLFVAGDADTGNSLTVPLRSKRPDDLQEQLGGLTERFSKPQPDLYNARHAARAITDTGPPHKDSVAAEP